MNRRRVLVGAILSGAALALGVFALLSDPETLNDDAREYGRLMRWRQSLIDAGVPPTMLEVPMYPEPAEWVHG